MDHLPSNPPLNNRSRIAALDALRQLAAMVVLVQHFLIIFEIKVPWWLTTGPFDAKAAVTLFFVLSGYVLTLSVGSEPISVRGYLNFGIRRVFRLYPMHLAAVVVSLVILVWIKHSGGFTRPLLMPVGFLDEVGFRSSQWLRQLTLVWPGMQSDFANPPVWTLMAEAKIAIIFPFVAWMVLKAPRKVTLLVVGILVIGSDFFANHLVGTVALIGQFALGALLAWLPKGRVIHFGFRYWIIFLIGSMVLYSCVSLRYTLPSVWIAYYLGSFGSMGLIVATVYWESFNRVMSALQRFFQVDISYGIYILHFPLMLWLRKLSGEHTTTLSAWALFAASVILTVGLSLVLMITLEKPAIRLGRHLTSSK